MNKPERLDLFPKPTPIDKLEIENLEIFVKREDETGILSTGNKIRKLEYFLRDAFERKCDSIITCGGLQSNHTRTTVYLARKLGFKPFIIVRGEPVLPPDGNFLLNLLLGAEIKFISRKEYRQVEIHMEKWKNELEKKGLTPYIIPEGGSSALGSWGYVDFVKEIKKFVETEKIEAIYFALGSGGTAAGLLIGTELYNVNVKLIGILVCDTVEFFINKINTILKEFSQLYDVPLKKKAEDIEFVSDYTGKGYGIPYPEEIETIKKIARYGIILDPVYTGKAFYGMLNHAKSTGFSRVMFIHTGGIFSIFPYKEYFGFQ